ncbi:Crp/Fnr family transcriptional regulator [Brevibacillus sp. SYSU BS000544]|uniref:Crp/Fnr family transcriptional regulator n=1 Tax=Brevibacillus sp. SYSU BS000544 TaxID=3416443 RepID=UPI003CE55A45
MILHKGEVLFRQGESGPLFKLNSGLLKVIRLQEDGTTFLFNFLLPGEVFPHHSLITPKEYHGTAIAVMTSEIEVIPAEDWYKRLANDPVQYRDVALLLQSRLRTMQQRIDQLTVVTPRERLNLLYEWFHTYLGKIPILELLTQEEIGQLIGVRRETVNRLLREMKEE